MKIKKYLFIFSLVAICFGQSSDNFKYAKVGEFYEVESNGALALLLKPKVSTVASARLGENFPYFIYSVGSISMKNQKTKEEILNSRFKDMKGADFSSKEKAGINALKKLSQNMNIDICD
jgi:hypothetical protein